MQLGRIFPYTRLCWRKGQPQEWKCSGHGSNSTFDWQFMQDALRISSLRDMLHQQVVLEEVLLFEGFGVGHHCLDIRWAEMTWIHLNSSIIASRLLRMYWTDLTIGSQKFSLADLSGWWSNPFELTTNRSLLILHQPALISETQVCPRKIVAAIICQSNRP